jgi:hypothetical protein
MNPLFFGSAGFSQAGWAVLAFLVSDFCGIMVYRDSFARV